MELPDYVQSVSFRLVQPDVPGSAAVRLALSLLSRTGLPLDALNTRLPGENGRMRRRLRDAKRACPRGPFATGAIINRVAAQLAEGEAFLALGVGDGFSLLAALSGNPNTLCIAIDDPAAPRCEPFERRFPSLRSAGHTLQYVHYRDYFRDYFTGPRKNPIGFCVVRAIGSDDLLSRLVACEPHLAENAVVLVENCNRAEMRKAGLHFIRSSRNQYRVLLDRCTSHHGALTFGDGLLLFQLLGRNAAVSRDAQRLPVPALTPAA
jgi:hypothetical protein